MASSKRSRDSAPVVRRFKHGFRWDEVEVEPYKLSARDGAEFRGASRQVLIGKRGERVNFHIRYFELEPGGFTTLERHSHSHVVIAIRGRGRMRVDEIEYSISPFDTIYVGPQKTHQLRAIGRSKFGFFCIVNARRDKPIPL